MERRHPPYPYDRRDPRSEPPYEDSFYPPYPDRYGNGIGRYPPGYDPRYPPPPPPRRGGGLPPSFYWAGLLVAVTTAIALVFDPGKVFSRGHKNPTETAKKWFNPNRSYPGKNWLKSWPFQNEIRGIEFERSLRSLTASCPV